MRIIRIAVPMLQSVEIVGILMLQSITVKIIRSTILMLKSIEKVDCPS